MVITLLEEMTSCTKCELRKSCDKVVTSSFHYHSPNYLFVGESPNSEDDLMGDSFSGRDGTLFKKLIEKSGINPQECVYTLTTKCMGKPSEAQIKICSNEWLNKEIEFFKPKIVIALGKIPIRILTGIKKTYIKVSDYAGVLTKSPKGDIIAPWYSINHILQRGKRIDEQTIQFLKKVKDYVESN